MLVPLAEGCYIDLPFYFSLSKSLTFYIKVLIKKPVFNKTFG